MDYKEIKELMKDMEQSVLSSIEIELPDGVKLKMKKENTNNVCTNSNSFKGDEESEGGGYGIRPYMEPLPNESRVVETIEEGNIITSPMVGTFYSSPSPDAEDFVTVGKTVKKGDTLCIIEAMKLMNEIESEFDGEIVEIYVKNEQMVEYGMPLFKIKTQ